jgi:hypothetical protein
MTTLLAPNIIMELIHIVGFSCVGKRSLIIRLCDPACHELRKRFGISGSTERFWDKPQFDDAFNSSTWRSIEDLKTARSDHMIHKWQLPTHHHVFTWKQLRTDVTHRAIALWRQIDDLHAQIHHKQDHGQNVPDWRPSIEDLKSHANKVQLCIDEMEQAAIPVEHVGASNSEYTRIERPAPY